VQSTRWPISTARFRRTVPYEKLPQYRLSRDQYAESRQQLDLKDTREYLVLGDISAVADHIADALGAFNIGIDPKSPAYSKLGIEVFQFAFLFLPTI
jgi:hypothetical protein